MPPDPLVASALCAEVLRYTSGLMPHSAIVHNLTMPVVCGVCVCVGVHVCVYVQRKCWGLQVHLNRVHSVKYTIFSKRDLDHGKLVLYSCIKNVVSVWYPYHW